MSLLSERIACRISRDAGDRDGAERQAERLRVGLAVDRARPVEHRVGPVELGEEGGVRGRAEVPGPLREGPRVIRVGSVGELPFVGVAAPFRGEERVGGEGRREEGLGVGVGQADEVADLLVAVGALECVGGFLGVDLGLGLGFHPGDEARVPGVGLVADLLVHRFGSAGRGDGRRDGRDRPVGDRDRLRERHRDLLGEVEHDGRLDRWGRGGVDGRDDLLGEGGLAMDRCFLSRDVMFLWNLVRSPSAQPVM